MKTKNNHFKTIVYLVLAVSLSTGCAGPMHQLKAHSSYSAGLKADLAGNYVEAEKQYSAALLNAEQGGSPESGISMVTYNLGRVKGYLGKYHEAEHLLIRALFMEERVTGPFSPITSMRAFELARLNYDNGYYEKSIPYYQRGLDIARKINVEQSDPIALAGMYDELAYAAKSAHEAELQANSKTSSSYDKVAAEAAAEALRLRAAYPGKKAIFIPKRYSKSC